MDIILAVLTVAAALGLFIYQRKRLAQSLATLRDKELGAIASRLGMNVIEGDPTTNLHTLQIPIGDFHRRLRMSGAPYGRPASFALVDGRKTDDYLVVRRVARMFSCILNVQTSIAMPAFEVVLRNPNPLVVAAQELSGRSELREVSTGQPQLDALFVVRAIDPRVGPALASALTLLANHTYVHLAGDGHLVWTSLTSIGLAYFSDTPEEILLAVETAACTLEGRPAPAQPLMAHLTAQAVAA